MSYRNLLAEIQHTIRTKLLGATGKGAHAYNPLTEKVTFLSSGNMRVHYIWPLMHNTFVADITVEISSTPEETVSYIDLKGIVPMSKAKESMPTWMR